MDNRNAGQKNSPTFPDDVFPNVDTTLMVPTAVARFEVTGCIVDETITTDDFLRSILVVAISDTEAYPVFSLARIKEILYHIPVTEVNRKQDYDFRWERHPSVIEDWTPSRYVFTPPPTGSIWRIQHIPPTGSAWSKWFTSDGSRTPIFSHSVPSDTVVDIKFEAIAGSSHGKGSKVTNLQGLIPGRNYRLGLDCCPKATSSWKPVGYFIA